MFESKTSTVVVVDKEAMGVVVSHRLHVLSHPPGATRVSHKPLEKIAWHSESSNVFNLPLQRSVVVVALVVVLVVLVLVVLVNVVEVLVLVLVVVE